MTVNRDDADRAEVVSLERRLELSILHCYRMKSERDRMESERDRMESERDRMESERDRAMSEVSEVREHCDTYRTRAQALAAGVARLKAENERLRELESAVRGHLANCGGCAVCIDDMKRMGDGSAQVIARAARQGGE